jgi:2-polyprenyl-6-methoxyphenol hydroxylase-like FAD-dependent oxidoreductase
MFRADMSCAGLNVGVIGGSVAGSTMAILLARAGCTVTVLECSGDEPTDRGAGIGVPTSVVDTLVDRDLVDAGLPCFVAHRFPRVWRTEREERYGHVAWDQTGSVALLNWGVLYRNLRERVRAGAYRTARATALRERADGKVVVELADGGSPEFELVVCADGYRSIGRQTLFPGVQPHYVGYVLWRGVLAEKDLAESAPLEGAVCWPSYRGGHGPFFFVPGPDGATGVGRRLVNWGLYLRVTEIERAELLTGKDGGHGGVPTMTPTREARLKQWAHEVLPAYYAEIVAKSTDTLVQAIYECAVPAYRQGRICLAGDAGALARPHTGTGALKGITDAITLAAALEADAPLDQALARWSEERTASGDELVVLGSQLGRALVDEAGDWSKMDAAAMQRWFSSVVTIPTEMFARAVD